MAAELCEYDGTELVVDTVAGWIEHSWRLSTEFVWWVAGHCMEFELPNDRDVSACPECLTMTVDIWVPAH